MRSRGRRMVRKDGKDGRIVHEVRRRRSCNGVVAVGISGARGRGACARVMREHDEPGTEGKEKKRGRRW